MNRMIFVNLPVSDLATARAFYTGLGFTVNETFSDESCTCIVVSDTIFVMLLNHRRFADFITGSVDTDPSRTEVINCLSAESRDEVDELYRNALANGGKPWLDTMEEGPMYGHSFTDPDGHVWEVLYMDMSQV
ncbi:MAG: Glyoxalase family protein [uncultured Propionibacteriaceae bacterium]|uniref:Glyoxalase family protein n=1 Tax=uncultured Propionibacteriaceae bacterium TaxID=257457 RepID=A0A6J4NRC6_9ACTN|nr:MAG: Glyoxalase family protein [uncultured Propionibacteriaceae bacterium]